MDFAELFAFCDLHASRWRFHRPDLETLLMNGPVSLSGHPQYYDRQGFPIPGEWDEREGITNPTLVWARMHQDLEYRRVAFDELPDGSYLSTVWLGLDHAFGGRPLIFETMRMSAERKESDLIPGASYHESKLFPDPVSGEYIDQLRYHTEEEALATHREIVRRIRRWEGH